MGFVVIICYYPTKLQKSIVQNKKKAEKVS